MNDKDLVSGMKRCKKLLDEYAKAVRPLAEEMAKRKSIHVFGKPGGYDGDLGCWEEGIDTICLHLTDEVGRDLMDKAGGIDPDKNLLYKKSKEFQDKINTLIHGDEFGGGKRPYIRSHY